MPPRALKPAVFLDRDGVLNRTTVRDDTPYPPQSLAEVEILPRVVDALSRLEELGLPRIVVTNQPDVARGTQSREAVEEINAFLMARLPLTAIYVCYHDNHHNCDCRKPACGMLTQAAREHQLQLSSSFMIGDRWSDIVAGQAAGCETFLINLPYSGRERCSPDHEVADLWEAAGMIEQRVMGEPGSR